MTTGVVVPFQSDADKKIFEDWTRGVAPAPAIAKVMAQELGWSEAEAAEQVVRYRESVAREQAASRA